MRNVRLAPPFRQRGMLRLGALSGMWGKVPAAAAAAFTVDAAAFDGTNDYLTTSGALTGAGAESSASGIVSFWMNTPRLATYYLWQALNTADSSKPNTSSGFFTTSGLFSDVVARSADNIVTSASTLSMTNDVAVAADTWTHVGISWNGTTGHFYVNGVEARNEAYAQNWNNNTAVNYANIPLWRIGARLFGGGDSKFSGGLAEFYFCPGQYLDFSVASNLQKFRSAAGKPVSLGATGSTPTGTTPAIYLHLDDGEAAANFATNRAGTGNFTVTGALTTFASSPSD